MGNKEIIEFIRYKFKSPSGNIPLHAPHFGGNERQYVLDTIDSTFVSSVGTYVTRFEEMMCQITGAKYTIATVNGTTALHLALVVSGVKYSDEVITQPLTFVATVNSISHSGASPVFVDVDKDTMGLSPDALKLFLNDFTYLNKIGECINKISGKRITACVPMHTFGFPLRINEIAEICEAHNIALIEDAAESLGSYYLGKHTGTYGAMGTFSFNGNKTVTCGGGGAIITNDMELALKAKHLSTTAKIQHPWEFVHDEVAFNYRMPNINAALACAQLEQLENLLQRKRTLANDYQQFFFGSPISFVSEMKGSVANYWLNTLLLNSKKERDNLLQFSNENGVMTRPAWRLASNLPMYVHSVKGNLSTAQWLQDRIINIPSGAIF